MQGPFEWSDEEWSEEKDRRETKRLRANEQHYMALLAREAELRRDAEREIRVLKKRLVSAGIDVRMALSRIRDLQTERELRETDEKSK